MAAVAKAKALVAKSNAERVLVMRILFFGKMGCCGSATEAILSLSSEQQRALDESPRDETFSTQVIEQSVKNAPENVDEMIYCASFVVIRMASARPIEAIRRARYDTATQRDGSR
jgi:hypothetical protein